MIVITFVPDGAKVMESKGHEVAFGDPTLVLKPAQVHASVEAGRLPMKGGRPPFCPHASCPAGGGGRMAPYGMRLFRDDLCSSCPSIETAYTAQVQAKQEHAPLPACRPPSAAVAGPGDQCEAGFRNKAKLVVGGSAKNPTSALWITVGASHGS